METLLGFPGTLRKTVLTWGYRRNQKLKCLQGLEGQIDEVSWVNRGLCPPLLSIYPSTQNKTQPKTTYFKEDTFLRCH